MINKRIINELIDTVDSVMTPSVEEIRTLLHKDCTHPRDHFEYRDGNICCQDCGRIWTLYTDRDGDVCHLETR